MRDGGQVHYGIHALQCLAPVGLCDVADFAQVHVGNCVEQPPAPHQRAHRMSTCRKRGDQMPADEARGAGDKDQR